MSADQIPPCYSDFDKSIRTLFDGYGFGALKLKSDLPVLGMKGLNVKTSIASKNENRKVQGNAEVAFTHKAFKVVEKVDGDGMLQLNVSNEDQVYKGLKTSLELVYNPETYHKSTALRATFKRPHVHVTSDVEFDFLGQVMRSSGAMSYPCGGMVGGDIMYETTLGRVTNASVGIAYQHQDFTASATWQGLVDFLVSVHHKVSPRLQAGAQFTSSPHRSTTNMILGMRYQLDDLSYFKAKISSQGTLGLAYNYRLTRSGPASNVTLSALVDTRRLNQPSHRLGLTVELS